jgi:hypothetical protein
VGVHGRGDNGDGSDDVLGVDVTQYDAIHASHRQRHALKFMRERVDDFLDALHKKHKSLPSVN